MNIRIGIVMGKGRMIHEYSSVYCSPSLKTLTLHCTFIHPIKGISRKNHSSEIWYVYESFGERRSTLKNNTSHFREGFTAFTFGNECGEFWQVYFLFMTTVHHFAARALCTFHPDSRMYSYRVE